MRRLSRLFDAFPQGLLLLVLLTTPSLSVVPQVGFAPLTVRATVRIPRDVENRAACLTIDGLDYYNQSCWELSAGAPTVFTRIWTGIPAGAYEGWVSVQQRARVRVSPRVLILVR